MLSKKNQCGKFYKGKSKGIKSESTLQKFTDDLLNLLKIKYIRIEDKFFSWVKMNAPIGVQKRFFQMFAGQADNILFLPISDKYCLSMHLELKSKTGQLHGKQKTNARDLSWVICRSPEEVEAAVREFRETADRIRDNEETISARRFI